jgi:hypothetical protein
MSLCLLETSMSISSVTSEALQLKLRQLLPSQQGFGTDLSASDTIIPIIDLTAAAEGSDVPEMLQTAINFGGATAFDVSNATAVLINTTGFYRIFGGVSFKNDSGSALAGSITMTDGATSKTILNVDEPAGGTGGGTGFVYVPLDFVVFLQTGDSLSAISNSSFVTIAGSTRQIADVNGTLVQPVGFTPQ